jgi:transposase
MGQETLSLTRAELKKVKVMEKIIDGHMTNTEGAVLLGISTRQVIRLKKTYLAKGEEGIAHQNRGRKPIHALTDSVKEQVVELYSTKYHGSNNCHLAELLEEHESLQISSPSVRRILLEKGIKQVKQRRRGKAHQPRKRRSQAGMLWQIDATPYAWLEDRAPVFALHAAIDDATSTVVGAIFRPNECREGYSLVMQQGIKEYGIPLGLYSDRHTIFRSPNEKLTVEQELAGEAKPLSNFGKAMAELHIEHIKAITPQAKGRVERLWVTFQDRLVIELRLLGINTIEEANAALPHLLQKHNQKFAVQPSETESAYIELDPQLNLNHIFTIREFRQLGHGHTLSYGGKIYTFAKPTTHRFDAKMTVEIRETLTNEVILWHQNEAFALRETEKTQRVKQTDKTKFASPHKPAKDHPWKTTYDKNETNRNKKNSFQEAMYSQQNIYAETSW